MEALEFKEMELAERVKYLKTVKHSIIGSIRQKAKYWDKGLIKVLLEQLEELEMSPELLISSYSIFLCYTNIQALGKDSENFEVFTDLKKNNFKEIYEVFHAREDFSDKVVDNLEKAVKLNEDGRIIDLCMQIIRNLLFNNIISPEKILNQNILKILESLVDNNKRINLVAQIIGKLGDASDEVKNYLLDEKNILDSIIRWIEVKGNADFKSSLLQCLILLCSNHMPITNYVRNNLDITYLINIIKYQYAEVNWKVAYLVTILSNDKNISEDFSNLIKQIIFQIARMLQSTEINMILEGTTMLYNLVKINEDEVEIENSQDYLFGAPLAGSLKQINSTIVISRNIYSHICDVGTPELLSKLLNKYSNEYLEEVQNFKEKSPEDKGIPVGSNDVVMDDDEPFSIRMQDHYEIILNSLNITKYLMKAKESYVNKIISAGIPSIIFGLLDNFVRDDIRICSWEWLRIIGRAKKPIKIKIIEEEKDLEKLFKWLIKDPNQEIKILGLAIIWNFAIDFPGMVLAFKEFIPQLNSFLEEDENKEIKNLAIKIIKNLLFVGHPVEVYKKAEKLIFDWIPWETLYVFLEDKDYLIREQAELIFKYLYQASQRKEENGENTKTIFDTIEDESIKDRIISLAK